MSAGASMSAALSAGAPSETYAKSIGASPRAPADVIIPALPGYADNARKNREDRLTGSCGGTELASRLAVVKPFEPKMLRCAEALLGGHACEPSRWCARAGCANRPLRPRLHPSSPPCFRCPPIFPLSNPDSGEEIRKRSGASTVFFHGPDSSPSLRATAAQARPVVAYQLRATEHTPSMGAPRGQQHNVSHFALSDMQDHSAPTEHAVPRASRVLEEETRAAMEAASSAAAQAKMAAHTKRQTHLAGSISFS